MQKLVCTVLWGCSHHGARTCCYQIWTTGISRKKTPLNKILLAETGTQQDPILSDRPDTLISQSIIVLVTQEGVVKIHDIPDDLVVPNTQELEPKL